MTRLATALVLLVNVFAVGCGGGSGGGGPAGVDGTKQVSAVNDTDRGALCDWFVGQVGGYGAAPTCADGFIEAPATKQECIDTFPSCADVTVSQLESCIETILAAQKTCTPQSLAAAQANTTCQTAAPCFQ